MGGEDTLSVRVSRVSRVRVSVRVESGNGYLELRFDSKLYRGLKTV